MTIEILILVAVVLLAAVIAVVVYNIRVSRASRQLDDKHGEWLHEHGIDLPGRETK